MFQRTKLQLAYPLRFMYALAFVAAGNSISKAIDDLPPAAQRDVTYAKDVAPILTTHCLKCHSGQDPVGIICATWIQKIKSN